MDPGRAFDRLAGPYRVPFLGAVAVATAVLAFAAAGVRLDRGSAALATDDAASRAAERRLRAAFPSGDTVLLAVTRDDLLSPSGLRDLAALTRSVAALPGVGRVDSLTTAIELAPGPFGAEPRAVVDDPDDPEAARAAIDRNPVLDGLLVSRDRTTAGVLVEFEPGLDGAAAAARMSDLRALAAATAAPDETRRLTGTAVQKDAVARLVSRDQAVLLPASVAVLGLALAAWFRRRSAVVLPLAVTAIAVAWTLGLYALAGNELNPLTSLLPPLLMTVSVSTAVHVYARWASPEFAAGCPPATRARETVRVLIGPCFLTALTTALGLMSLTVADLPAVRRFGVYGAIGVLISFALNVTVLPVVLARLRPPEPGRPRGVRLDDAVARLAAFGVRRRRAVLAATLAVVAIAAAGAARIRNNTDLVAFLKPDEPLARDTRWIDAHLTGTAVLELMIERADGAPWTGVDDVARLDRFERAVAGIDGVTGTLGLPDLLRAVARAETSDPDAGVPDDAGALAAAFDLLDAAEDPTPVRRVRTADGAAVRTLVRVHAMGSARAEALFAEVLARAASVLGSDVRVTAGGPFHAVATDSNRLVAGLVESVGLALATVLASLALLFRSPRVLVAAAVPNVVPVLATFGFMGFAGIDLSTGTAMIASVVLGIAVDDTIHWLARFREGGEGDVGARAVAASRLAGRPLAIASSVLVLGFWVGALGSFLPTIYFSLLTGATILAALACDLVVLPACLVALHPSSGSSPSSPAR